MVDARIFPKTLEDAKVILEQVGAVYKGEYFIVDTIYASVDAEQTLDKTFLRLRIIPKNIWNEKPVIVALKNTEIKVVGKQSYVPLKKEFDTNLEALQFIEIECGDLLTPVFTFERTGWQYFIGEDGVDLEDIEGHPSIEFKSKTEEGIKKLLALFNISESEVIRGPSVVTVKKLLDSDKQK